MGGAIPAAFQWEVGCTLHESPAHWWASMERQTTIYTQIYNKGWFKSASSTIPSCMALGCGTCMFLPQGWEKHANCSQKQGAFLLWGDHCTTILGLWCSEIYNVKQQCQAWVVNVARKEFDIYKNRTVTCWVWDPPSFVKFCPFNGLTVPLSKGIPGVQPVALLVKQQPWGSPALIGNEPDLLLAM